MATYRICSGLVIHYTICNLNELGINDLKQGQGHTVKLINKYSMANGEQRFKKCKATYL